MNPGPGSTGADGQLRLGTVRASSGGRRLKGGFADRHGGARWGTVGHGVIPALGRRRQDHQKVEVFFGYIMSLRPAWAT